MDDKVTCVSGEGLFLLRGTLAPPNSRTSQGFACQRCPLPA